MMVFVLPATNLFAGTEEEKAALAKILPRFQEAWNAEKPKDFMALFDADYRMKKAYEKDDAVKQDFERSLKQTVQDFGNIESFEIRKYIEKTGRFVVRVKYAKKGVIPGTFAVKGRDKDAWFLLDFNIDGQGEPELKE